MKNLFKKLRQFFCIHHYAKNSNYDVVRNKISRWDECIKCGKVK